MKPQHAATKRLSRCSCCVSTHAKRLNQGRTKPGNSAARQKAKRDIRNARDS